MPKTLLSRAEPKVPHLRRNIYIGTIASYIMEKTTIQVSQSTLERLKNFKKHERQSYDDLLNSIINEIEEEPLTNEEIKDIQVALEEVKRGHVYPIEQVAKELGIKLR